MDADRGELRFFLPVSLGAHLALLVTFQLSGIGRDDAVGGHGAGLGRGSTEVVIVNRPLNPEAHPVRQNVAAARPRVASRVRGPLGMSSSLRMASTGVPSTAEEGVPVPAGEGRGPLCMRDCKPQAPSSPDLDAGERDAPPGPAILRQREGHGLKMVRYADGGRLFSSTAGPVEGGPHLGLLGLMDLADGQVGGRPGHDACNLYRAKPPGDQRKSGPAEGSGPGSRTLVLLVDTSASVGDESTACAAGAALAALDRGFEVEVVNFSSRMMHQAPTHDPDAIYETLSAIQRRGTIFPDAGQLMSSSARPRDFVAITDTAAGNYQDALDGYQKVLRAHPGNRGLLYLLGQGVVCKRCLSKDDERERCSECLETTRAPLEAFAKAGFQVETVDP